jgi:hypothetical protein
VLQHATDTGLAGDGALIRVAPDGTRTVMASAGLVRPTSVVIAPPGDGDGGSDDAGEGGEADAVTFYVSNCGTCAGIGEVIRVRP